jgi:hypothetical protein
VAVANKIPNKARTLEIWDPLVGRPAAVALYRGKWVLGVSKWVALADFVLVWVAFGFSRTLAVGVAWVGGILTVGFGCSGFFFLWQWHAEAGRALGVRITGKNPPPSDRTRYLEWCRQNGVQPLNSSPDGAG